MENTSSAMNMDETQEANAGLKVVCPIAGTIITVCAGYIMVSLIMHAVRTRKKMKKLREAEIREKGSVRTRPRNRGVAKLSAWLGYLSVASSILAFFNCAADHALLYLIETTDTTCKLMQAFSFVFYPCGVSCVYSFLWVRQRVFYNNPTLGILHSKYLRWFSFAILPVFLSLMFVGLITTLVKYTYATSSIGCIETSGIRSPKIVLYVGAMFMQASLLALFVYPLKEHKDAVDDALAENKIILSLIKRACVTTGICVVADTVAFVVIMLLPPSGPVIIVNILRDGNLLVNVTCIACSFVDWKLRLGSICNKEDNDGRSTREVHVIRSSIKTDSLVTVRKGSPQTTLISVGKSTKKGNISKEFV